MNMANALRAPGSHEPSPTVSALRVSIPFADLDAEYARHLAHIAAIDAEFDAWSARLDAALNEWEKLCAR